MAVPSRLIEWYFGLPNGPEGGMLRWSLQAEVLQEFPGGRWTGLILCAVVIVGLVVISVKAVRSLPPRRRWPLILARIVSTGLLLVMFCQLTFVVTRFGRSRVALLIDTSASMAQGDAYSPRERERLQLRPADEATPTRMELLQAKLTEGSGRALQRLLEQHRLDVYQFSTDPLPVNLDAASESESGNRRRVLANEIQALTASGSRTSFQSTLGRVWQMYRDDPLSAIVVLTDGNPTAPEEASAELMRRIRESHVPLHFVGVGSTQQPLDLAVEAVHVEPVAFADRAIPVKVDLTATSGVPAPQRLKLLQEGSDQPLDEVEVTVPESGSVPTALLEIPGLPGGRHDLRVVFGPALGESELRNNTRRFHIQIRETRLRVLYLEEQPRWEYRHLKNLLERDRDVQLHTFLLDRDTQFAVEDRTALAELPETLSDLNQYDAVILGDVDWARLPDGFADLLQAHVGQFGAGLIILPGRLSNWGSVFAQELDELFPAVWEKPASEVVPVERQLAIDRASVTEDFLGEPVSENLGVSVEQLPRVHVFPADLQLRAGASVLMSTSQDGDGSEQPAVMTQRFGRGHVLLQLFEDTWRWRWVAAGRAYHQYWAQAVRFVSRRRMYDQLPDFELFTDRESYLSGEPVVLKLRSHRPFSESTADLQAVVSGESFSQTYSFRASEQDAGLYEATIEGLPPGDYRATLSSLLGPSLASSEQWTVMNLDRERSYRPLNVELLKHMAEASDGKFYSLWQLNSMLDQLPRRADGAREQDRIPLWNRPEVLLLLLTAFITEWILRRRLGQS